MSDIYKLSGVDVESGYKSVELIKKKAESTFSKSVIGSLGGFSALFELDVKKYKNPVLCSGADGVGTKLKIAYMLNKHDTIGIDCVAMCVNDVLCCGAKPLFFLDYLAVEHNDPSQVAEIVSGIAKACQEADCSLIGGETAEMPSIYKTDEYDLAGFCVGAAEKDKLISSSMVKEGHSLIGLASSGVHSNGFSLIRNVFNLSSESSGRRLAEYSESLGKTLGEELITPTKIYVKKVLAALDKVEITGISHITGGGFGENIPRMLPDGLGAKIDRQAINVPPIFDMISQAGGIPESEMFNIFNMGVGMVIASPHPDEALEVLGCDAKIIGEVINGSGVSII